jgi:DNA-binding response OmpR family regulator
MGVPLDQNLVVLVDDDDAIREAFTEVLESEGYDVRAYRDGREAIEGLGDDSGPCLILLDWMMPVMNGEQFLEARGTSLRETPVVVVSAISRLLARGVPGVAELVEKPIDIDVLLNVVRRHSRKAAS